MQVRFLFKHFESSPGLSQHTEEKLAHMFERYTVEPLDIHFTFSIEHLDHHSHCSARFRDGFHVDVDAIAKDMYVSVDTLMVKLEAQVKKHKEKIKDHRSDKTIRDLKEDTFDPEDPDLAPIDAVDLLKLERKD